MKIRFPQASSQTPDEFRERVRSAFGFLVETAGFHEEPVPSSGFHNPVAVWFANKTTRIVVEGINWGMNARVALGQASEAFENFDLEDLVAELAPSTDLPAEERKGGQLTQLPQLADWLRVFGSDVLSGDFRVFPRLGARVDLRKAQFRQSPTALPR